MAEWFIKKITGEDLIDKALDLAIAEENANMIINALRPELEEIAEDHDPIVLKVEGGGTASTGGMNVWQSKRFEEEYTTVVGSRRFIDVNGVGRIHEVIINHPSSSNFSVELNIDGHKWYSDTYTNLAQTSVADSHLSVYQESDTLEYFVVISDINFIQGFDVIIGASNLTFDVLRVNYDVLV